MNDLRRDIRRIAISMNAMEGAYEQAFKAAGAKGNLLWLLYAIDDGEMHSQKQICEEWLFPKTTINTIAKECQALGYITLRAIPGRKRELQISLTEKGESFAREMLRGVYEAEERALVKTMEHCAPSFISDLEMFNLNLKTALEETAKLNEASDAEKE